MESSTGRALIVKVHRARSLPRMDLVGHIDPYVKVEAGSQTAQTEIIPNEPNPSWMETFTLSTTEGDGGKLRLALWDHDRWSPDDLVGVVELELSALAASPRRQEWFSFEGQEGEVELTAGFGFSYALMKARLAERPGFHADDRTRTLFFKAPALGLGVYLALRWYEGKVVQDEVTTSNRLTLHIVKTMRALGSHAFAFEGETWNQSWEEAIQYGPLKVLEETWLEGDVFDGFKDQDLVQLTVSGEAEVEVTLKGILSRFGYKKRAAPDFEALAGLEKAVVDADAKRVYLPYHTFLYCLDRGEGQAEGLHIHDSEQSLSRHYRLGYSGAGFLQTRACYARYETARLAANLSVRGHVRLSEMPASPRPATISISTQLIEARETHRLSALVPETF